MPPLPPTAVPGHRLLICTSYSYPGASADAAKIETDSYDLDVICHSSHSRSLRRGSLENRDVGVIVEGGVGLAWLWDAQEIAEELEAVVITFESEFIIVFIAPTFHCRGRGRVCAF